MPLSHSQKLSHRPFASIIGRKIILILILISSFITLLATLLQLYNDYQDEVSAVEVRYQELNDVHATSLAVNLWEFNERQLNIRLQGLTRLPDISFVQVRSATDGKTWQAGEPVSGDKISRTLSLEYRANDNSNAFVLGELYVESSSERIYKMLLATFVSVLLTNAIKTFIVAAMILWVFHLSINNRVMDILNYLDNFRPSQKLQTLELERTPVVTSDDDELSVLALSINQLSRTLHKLYQETEQERDRFTDFANSSSDWLWEADASGRLIFASDRMLEQLLPETYGDRSAAGDNPVNGGNTPVTETPPVYGLQLTKLIPSETLAQALAERRDFKGLEVELMLGENKHSFIFHAKAVTSPEQHLIFRGSAIDISHRKAAEQAIRELNDTLEQRVAQRTRELEHSLEELEQAQSRLIEQEKMASLGALVAGIAHEINTPLGVAITAGSLLEPEQENPNHEAYQLMQDNLQRVVRLVQVFKQTSAGSQQARVESVVVRQLLNDIVIGLQSSLQEKQIQVELECDDDLNWPTITHCWVQIFHQLFNNSLLHAFDEGPGEKRIRIQIQVLNQQLHIDYRDNGKGMTPSRLAQIFEPFQTSKRHQGCAGLGMHIVYNQVAQALKGEIQAESEPGQGLKIKIQLPPLPETLPVGS